MKTFYVMMEVDGDECCIAHRQTFEAARLALDEQAQQTPRAFLSIWDSGGAMLMLWDRRHGGHFTTAGTEALGQGVGA